jgi:uncharacterized protein (TIGR04141 family)
MASSGVSVTTMTVPNSKSKDTLPNETISVYLLREGITSAKQALREDPDSLEQHRVRGLGDDAVLYLRRRPPTPPKWTRLLDDELEPPLALRQSSSAAVLIVKARGRLFAITFGSGGRFMLGLNTYERNFGLRVAANSVDPDQIRSVQSRTFIDTALQIRRQVAEVSDIIGLQMDVQRDLLTRLEGSVRPGAFGKRIDGADSVRLTEAMRAKDLKSVCSRLLTTSQGAAYKERYPWIDWLAEVTDIDERHELEEEVLKRLLNGDFDRFDVYPPEMIGEEVVDFKTRRGTVVMEPTRRLLEETIRRIGARDPKELGDALRRLYICARDENGDPLKRWSWWDCLYYEHRGPGKAVVLDRGSFFRVKGENARAINDFAKSLAPSDLELPEAMRSETEPHYNDRVSQERDDIILLDRKLVRPVAGESQIEICDLFSAKGHLIHVKRRKGGSSGLSHLFAQASVTSRLLRGEDGAFAVDVRSQLGPFAGTLSQPPVPSENPVVLAVILASESRGEGAAALPFFSKVFLRQNAQALQMMGFTVYFDEISAPMRG